MPVRPHLLSAFVGALAVLACSRMPASALEHTRMEAVWVEAVSPGGGAPHAVPALLNLPSGWMAGDAAVVMLSDGPWPGLAHERLVAALLDEGAAVLELDVNAARGFSPENARTGPPPTAAELVSDLRGAVEVLQRDAAAGLVVALGHGAGGDAALLAAAAAREGPGEGLAAGASLGPGPAAFALGGVPREGEMGVHRGWPVRAGRLCAVLAVVSAPSGGRAEEAECQRALVGTAARVMRAGGDAGCAACVPPR